MVKTLKTIAISTSCALVATSAMASVGQQQRVAVSSDFQVAPETLAQIDAAIAKKDLRVAVSSVFSTLAKSFAEDGLNLDEKYFQARFGKDGSAGILLAQGQDSTVIPGMNCYGNCYTNCHVACHSSRGWR